MTERPRSDLEDERAFLLRSLEDLDAERDAGDLAEADYRVLRDRYTSQAATVLRALHENGGAPTATIDRPPGLAPGAVDGGDADRAVTGTADRDASKKSRPVGRWRPRRRRALVWGALGVFGAAAVVLVVAELATRLPGQTGSGSVSLSAAQQQQRTLDQAAVLETRGNAPRALALYRQVLRQDPTQEQALAEAGWLEYQAGVSGRRPALLTQGQRDEQAAEQVAPGAYAPHLYLGSMLLVESQPSAAADEFTRFLSAHPPADVVRRAWPYVVRAFTGARRPVPAAPPGVDG